MRVGEDIFKDSGRGTIISGMIETGTVTTGDKVFFISTAGKKKSCSAEVLIEGAKTTAGVKASVGTCIALLLHGVKEDEVAAGMLISGSPL
ncbi:MAG: hypothetical protein NTX59_09470 [Elusimicrobia bacterium]|nr:hypothetical protein [Elusimicrobiota bacterium]